MSNEPIERCYLCNSQLCDYVAAPGETPPPNQRTRDHIPPAGLFLPPKPHNLVTVPCCFRCNNEHSNFDEQLRLVATIPFDRNPTGQQILTEKVFQKTFKKGRQAKFIGTLARSMQACDASHDLIQVKLDTGDFKEGMIRITKGLLYALHPGFDYRDSKFDVISIQPHPEPKQLGLMASLKAASHFELGNKAFQCWRHVDAVQGGGAWMLIFYECFGFFVSHAKLSSTRSSAS